MKTGSGGSSAFLVNVYRFLLILILCLAGVLIGGTVYHFAGADGTFSVPGSDDARSGGNSDNADSTFTGIGRLRLETSDPNPATVIVSITFPYSPADRPFSEELAARVNSFRTIAGDYFRSYRPADLRKKNEAEIKDELLNRFNGVLRLGKISALYFHDYMIID